MPSLTGPPSNSSEDMVDLMRESEFFFHSFAEGESKEEEEASVRREAIGRGGGTGGGGAWTRGGVTWHHFPAEAAATHTGASSEQSTAKERTS